MQGVNIDTKIKFYEIVEDTGEYGESIIKLNCIKSIDGKAIPQDGTALTRVYGYVVREPYKLIFESNFKIPKNSLISIYNNFYTPLTVRDFGTRHIYVIELKDLPEGAQVDG